MRRLPVYILIDTSGSMKGEPIESVKVGLADMVASLRQDPYALETVCMSIITYDREVKQLIPLTPLENLQLPEIVCPESGPTHMGAALKRLCEEVDKEVRKGSQTEKGDWRPLLFNLTDGHPSDLQEYNRYIPIVKSKNFATIVCCAAGPRALIEPLKKMTDDVVALATMDSTSLRKFFQYVSASVSIGGKSVGSTDGMELPAPPPEFNLVV